MSGSWRRDFSSISIFFFGGVVFYRKCFPEYGEEEDGARNNRMTVTVKETTPELCTTPSVGDGSQSSVNSALENVVLLLPVLPGLLLNTHTHTHHNNIHTDGRRKELMSQD